MKMYIRKTFFVKKKKKFKIKPAISFKKQFTLKLVGKNIPRVPFQRKDFL